MRLTAVPIESTVAPALVAVTEHEKHINAERLGAASAVASLGQDSLRKQGLRLRLIYSCVK